MIRKGILLVAVVLLSTAGFAQAEDDLGIEVGASYVSRYLWRGFDLYPNDHSAFQPFVNFDLWGSGWTFSTWYSRANGGGFENLEEINYILSYGNLCCPDTWHATEWEVGYVYYNYPDGPVRDSSGDKSDPAAHELYASFAWPNIGSCGIVPSYTVIRMWQDESGRRSDDGSPWSTFRGAGGFLHTFGLSKDVEAPNLCIFANSPEQVIHLSAEVSYNDSMGASSVDHDWSHAVFGISTDFAAGNNGTITPGVWFQKSMDDSVNTEDEYWFGVTGTWKVK